MSKTYVVTAVRTRRSYSKEGLTWTCTSQLPAKCLVAANKRDAVRLAGWLYGGKGLNISAEEV